MTPARRAWLWDGVWFILCAVLSTTWIVTASARLSATFDEPFYVAAGIDAFRTGSNRLLLDAGTMPLPVHVAALPVYVWERLRGRPFDPAEDLDQILPVARLGTLLFWWLLLGYGWFAARQIGGPWGGRLAVALLACEPNLLAHAGLAATDLAVAACLLAFWVHFRAGRGGPWWKRVGVPTLLFAVAVLAKASAAVFGVIGMVVLEAEHRAAAAGARPLRAAVGGLIGRRFWADLLQIAGLGLGLVLLYCGSDWQAAPSFVAWAEGLPDGWPRDRMRWLAENLRVFNNGWSALEFQFRHNLGGHGVYLLGTTDPQSLWYYFPVALSIKLTLTTLALPLLAAAVAPRALLNWACALAGALLLFSLTCRVQIGVRFMLPLIALAVIGPAAGLARVAQALPAGSRRRALAAGAAAGLAWAAWSAAAVWPQGLCYVNELWGGTERGYLCLSDSNYDWGQGLNELAEWQKRHADAPLEVWYFGTDRAALRRVGEEFDPATLPGVRPEQVRARFRGRRLAVGTTLLYGDKLAGDAAAFAASLRGRPPAARAGTFFIYDFQDGE
jgi:hypothetical protein